MTQAVNLAAVGSNANSSGTLLTSGTAVTASGTAVNFTGIPSWVKRVTVMFSGVSTNGSSLPIVRIGPVSGVVSTGYQSVAGYSGSTNTFIVDATSFAISPVGAAAPTLFLSGAMTLLNVSGNIWAETVNVAAYASIFSNGAGSITLSGPLDRIRITTVNGTDVFDAGTINIMWE